jgi:alanine dehydrogenase
MADVIFLDNRQVSEILKMSDCIDVVEELFYKFYEPESETAIQMPPKTYLDIPSGDFRAMPALVENTAGIKWCGVHLDDTGTKRKVNIFAKVLINDVETGKLLAIMDGEIITAIRTAAVTGVATKYLSPQHAKVASFIGCGNQTRYQIEAILRVRDIEQIRLFDLDKKRASEMSKRFAAIDTAVCGSLEECVSNADIVTTLTPSRKGFLEHEWLKPVVHINAVGADAQGKRELDISVLNGIDLVCYDEWQQCSHSGEVQYSHEMDGSSRGSQTWCPLAHVVAKALPTSHCKQTLFDATGLAIEDIVTARLIYDKVKEDGA